MDGPNATNDFLVQSNITASKLLPNPTAYESVLDLTLKTSQKLSVSVFDANGQLLRVMINNQKFDAGTHKIPVRLNGLTKGIYFVQIRTKAGDLVVKKIIKT